MQESDTAPSREGIGIAQVKPDGGSLGRLCRPVNRLSRRVLAAHRYQAYAEVPMTAARLVKLFRNGRNQAVRIPVDLQLPGEDAWIHRDGDRLVIEPVLKVGLSALLARMEPLDEDWPEPADPPPRPETVF